MKKLTPEEYKTTHRKIQGNWSPVTKEVVNMQIGEHLLIEKKDWNQKKAPFAFVGRIQKKYKTVYTVESLTDATGWIITRIS